MLTRPVTGLLGLALLALLWQAFATGRLVRAAWAGTLGLVACCPVLLIGAWTIRNYVLTGDFVPLEVAFHPQSHDRMKPEFQGLFGFAKAWGEDGAVMNTWETPLFDLAVGPAGDTSIAHVRYALARLPPRVVAAFGRPRLRQVLRQYQLTSFSLKPYYDKQVPLPKTYSVLELNTQSRFDSLTREYAHRYPLRYYGQVPLIYLGRVVFNSGTSSSYLYQQPFRHHRSLVLLRLCWLGVHVLAYLTILFNAWHFRRNWLRLTIFCVVPALYLAFFVFYFKEIEQRYAIPALLIALLGMYNPLAVVQRYVERRRTSAAAPTA